MSIPTGADFRILQAKGRIREISQYRDLYDPQISIAKLQDAMEDLIAALELIQRERQTERE